METDTFLFIQNVDTLAVKVARLSVSAREVDFPFAPEACFFFIFLDGFGHDLNGAAILV